MSTEKGGKERILALARAGKSNVQIALETGTPLRTVQVATKAAREAGELPPLAAKEPIMSSSNEPERRELRIDQIRMDHGINPRAELSREGVIQYAEYYRWYSELSPVQEAKLSDDERLPDPVVFFDGKVYWLSSGFHRVAGAGTGIEGVAGAGLVTIRCEIHRGSRRDAMVHALGQNARQGVMRSRADLSRAVEIALTDSILKDKSNRELAKILHCNESVIRRKKGLLDEPKSLPPVPEQSAKPKDTKGSGKPSAAQPHPTPTDPSPPPPPGTAPIAEPKPAEIALPRDQLGRLIPPALQPVFAQREALEDAAKKYGSAAGTLKKIDADPAVGNFLRTRPHLETDSRSLAAFIRWSLAPYAVCPACDGTGDKRQCPSCGGRGWLTRVGFDGLAPEMQEHARSFAPGDAWEGDSQADADALAAGAAEPQRYQPAGPGLDPTGRVIPAELRDLFQADFLFDSARELDRIQTALQSAKSWLAWLRPETLASLAEAARGIRDSIPFCVHRECKGKGCGDCLMSGYWTEWKYEGEQMAKKQGT